MIDWSSLIATIGGAASAILGAMALFMRARARAAAQRHAGRQDVLKARVFELERALAARAVISGLTADSAVVADAQVWDTLRFALARYPVILAVLDSDGRYLHTAGYREHLGWSDVPGKRWAELVPPEHVDDVQLLSDALLSHPLRAVRTRVMRAGGGEVWVLWWAARVDGYALAVGLVGAEVIG